jgi:hypothetical protein
VSSLLRSFGCLASSGLFLFSAVSAFPSAASARVLVKAQGRCKMVSGGYVAFNGHCSFKHKRAGGTDAYVVKLDDGSDYIFRGPNPDALSVQTYRGILNVKHNAKNGHDVFRWDDGEKRRLSVKLDHVQNADAEFDDDSDKATVAAIAGGAAAVALIGALISGQNSSNAPEPATIGAPVRELQDLVGARGGQAEQNLISKGYQYRGGTKALDSSFSYWQQPRTGNCVGIQTSDGRYQQIVYTEKSYCN